MIAVVDYGMGNLRSVQRAFAAVGAPATVTADHDEIRAAERSVLPGVGAFGMAMERLNGAGLSTLLTELVMEQGRPFLGICLGMQLICRDSDEHGFHQGLGWLDAPVRRIEVGDNRLRVPHIGWNDVTARPGSELLDGDSVFYFVHGHHVDAADDVVAGTVAYGRPLAAALEWRNVWATQFHPEKSQEDGLAILRRFMAFDPSAVAA
jgi:glutamine amidotransferase